MLNNVIEGINIDKYISYLEKRNKTFILLKNNEIIYEDDSIGVKALRMLRQKKIYKNQNDKFILIDKIIGKAAVVLAALNNIDEIYTPLASAYAIEFSKELPIKLFYKEKVDFIENRTHDGMCPIEKSVLNLTDLLEAEKSISKTIEYLMNKNTNE